MKLGFSCCRDHNTVSLFNEERRDFGRLHGKHEAIDLAIRNTVSVHHSNNDAPITPYVEHGFL